MKGKMSKEMNLEDFPTLSASNVYIKDKENLLRTINKIVREGADHLQVVTDFDLTLTKQHVDGKHVLSSFGMFSKCKQLPESYAEEAKKLYQKYRPIEINPTLPLKDKVAAMNEWMLAAQKLLCGFEFDAAEMDEVAKKHAMPLRDGTKLLFQQLNATKVPVLVFSAGLGDMVEAVLRNNDVLYDNVNVISNFLKFEGKMLHGFKNNDAMIHVFNKNETALDEEYCKLLEHRRNVVLMGDSTGDADMANGLKKVDAIIKIGFLYEHANERLSEYMDTFDIVLVDDQTMQVTQDILRPILS